MRNIQHNQGNDDDKQQSADHVTKTKLRLSGFKLGIRQAEQVRNHETRSDRTGHLKGEKLIVN